MTEIDDPVPPWPPENEPPVFEAPWQARAFGVAVAMCRDDEQRWGDFQQRLIARIDVADGTEMERAVENVYYQQWLESLEDILIEEGIVTREEIEGRKHAFSTGERDASEFVVGDRAH